MHLTMLDIFNDFLLIIQVIALELEQYFFATKMILQKLQPVFGNWQFSSDFAGSIARASEQVGMGRGWKGLNHCMCFLHISS